MSRKLRTRAALAVIVAAIATTPVVAGCVPVPKPGPVIRGVSHTVFVTALDPQALGDFKG
jgi:hypothetical protein